MESNTSFEKISPVKPAAPYLGGKLRLAKTLCQIINGIEHTTYVEPFVGMGGVFLRRDHKAKAEVINDINYEVANLFRILQRHYVAFLEHIKFQITTRVEFERLTKTEPTTLTDIERACRFLYLQRTAFGGKVAGQNFGVSVDRSGRFDVTKLAPILEALHERLSGVIIECLPYDQLITRYDKNGTLFYLDPPYLGGENDYGKNVFDRSDFERIARSMRKLKGTFILSINDAELIRELFADFIIKEVQVGYSIASKKAGRRRFGELIISNRPLD